MGEGAALDCLGGGLGSRLGNLADGVLLAVEGVVGLPLGHGGAVVLSPLVAEEKTVVTPVGGGKSGGGLKVTDKVLLATELSGRAHTVNFPKDGALRDSFELVEEVGA